MGHKAKIKILCKQCKKEFKIFPSVVKFGRKYCSLKCKYKFQKNYTPWNKGKKGSTNSGSFKKGHKHIKGSEKGQFKKGAVSWNKGKSPSPETREKISKKLRGSKSSRWKGGITEFYEHIRRIGKYIQWRSDIKERDKWTCQTCYKRGCYLEVHHIKSFYQIILDNKIKTINQAIKCEELWNIDNGVTLCQDCHSLTKGARLVIKK